MRELRGAGLVSVKHIPTEENEADLYTKILARAAFEKHRAKVMNSKAAVDGVGKQIRASRSKREFKVAEAAT